MNAGLTMLAKVVLLSVLSITFGLGLSEAILRVLEPIPLVGVQRSPCNILPDPLLKVRYRPNSRDRFERLGEIDLFFEVNNLGFHDIDREVKKNEVFRVAVIGDSFTAARSVAISETWTQVTEKRLSDAFGRPIEVINLGISGTGTAIHARIAEKYLPLLNPDLLLHIYTVGDQQDDSYPGLMNDCYRGFVLVYQEISVREVLTRKIDQISHRRMFGWLMKYFYSFRAINFYTNLWPRMNVLRQSDLGMSWRVDKQAVDTADGIGRMRDISKKLGAEFVTIPMPLKGLGSASEPIALDSIDEVSDAAKKTGVRLIDIRPILAAEIASRGIQSKEMFWRYDGHHNRLGNDVLGSVIANVILTQGLNQ